MFRQEVSKGRGDDISYEQVERDGAEEQKEENGDQVAAERRVVGLREGIEMGWG